VRIAVVAAVLCLSMIGLSAADPAKASIRKDTHIPAGGLGPALHVLARQYDFQVLYRTEVVGSLRTRGAVGELSSEEALEQLLKGTGLTYRYLDQKTITILPLPTNPPATVAPPTGSTVSSSPDEYQPQSRSPWYKFLLAQTNERVAAEGVTSGQSESGPSPSPSESQPTQLEEVLVTANKIAEPSSRVPVSVSTVTGATLEQQQITNYADLSRAIPNISFTDYGGPGTSNIEIRGISSRAGSSTTGIYLDDVPLSDLNSYETGEAEPRFFDISRVEVLRGPQGTIYGASSMGGTIHFVSNRPDVDADSVRIHTQLGGTDGGGFNYEADSVVNVVLQPGVAAMRVGALYDHESGWIDRVDPNTGYNVTARNINDINTTVVRVAIDWRPNAALTVTPAVFLQRVSTGGQDTFGIGLPNFESPALVAQVARDEYAITSLTFNYDLGFSDLTAVTGYFWRDDDRTMDTTPEDSPYIGQLLQQQFGYGGATISALAAPGNYLANINQVHQEIRLASKPPGPDDRWSWIVGLYYSRARTTLVDVEYMPGFNSTFESLYRTTPLDALGAAFPNDLVYYAASAFTYSQSAAFGQVAFRLTPALKLTLGARYEIGRNSLEFTTAGFFGGGSPPPFYGSAKGDATTPRAALSYDVSPSTMIYASAAEGFRDGGVDRPVPVPLCSADLASLGLTHAPSSYASDSLWSYELGAKTRALQDSLVVSGALFDIRWSHMQSDIELPTCTFDFMGNAGSADIKGVELELSKRFLSHITTTLTGNYTSPKIVEPVPIMGIEKGDHVPGVPYYSIATSIEYTQAVTSDVQGFLRANGQWIGPSQGVIYHDDPDFHRPPYAVAGAGAGARWRRGELSLFVTNVFNETKVIQRPDNAGEEWGITVRPRTYGLSGTYSF